MTLLQLWLLTTVIPGLSSTFDVIGGASIIFMVIIGILCLIAEFDRDFTFIAKKYVKIGLLVFLTSATITCLIPTERQILIIAGGYTATNNAEIRKLPTNAAIAVNAWLDAVGDAVEAKKNTKKDK